MMRVFIYFLFLVVVEVTNYFFSYRIPYNIFRIVFWIGIFPLKLYVSYLLLKSLYRGFDIKEQGKLKLLVLSLLGMFFSFIIFLKAESWRTSLGFLALLIFIFVFYETKDISKAFLGFLVYSLIGYSLNPFFGFIFFIWYPVFYRRKYIVFLYSIFFIVNIAGSLLLDRSPLVYYFYFFGGNPNISFLSRDPFTYSIKEGNKVLFQRIMNIGHYNTPCALCLAVKRMHYDLAKIMILDYKYDINSQNINNLKSPLMYAILNCSPYNEEITHKTYNFIKFLLSKGANPNLKDYKGATSLFYALKRNCVNIFVLLIQHGANINAKTKDGYSLIHIAASIKRKSVAKWFIDFLISKNININDRDKRGYTPLHIALLTTNYDIAFYLLDKRADPNVPDNLGNTPIFLLFKNWEIIKESDKDLRFSVLKKFVQKGAFLDVSNNYGDTPVIVMAKNMDYKRVKELIDLGANINFINSKGEALIHIATLGKYIRSKMRYIVRKGFKIAINRREIIKRHVDHLKKIIELGADVNLRDSYGRTPLHIAVINDYPYIALVLLKNGASPYIRDKKGKLPIDYAKKKNMKRLLESYMEK